MPRGQKPGWKLAAVVPKVLPDKPVRIATGVWLRPSGRFFAYLYHQGRDVFIGSYATPHEAAEAREEKRHELKTGRPLVRRTATAATLTTFAETVYFPETFVLVKDSTQRTTRSRYNQHVAPFFRDVALRDITYDRCSQFRAAMMAKDVSGQTRREAVRLVRAILDDAAKRNLLPANPARLLPLPSKGGTVISVPSYADALKIVAAIRHPVAHMAASFLLRTGARLNEALSLTWSNVDTDERKVLIAHSIDQVTGKLVTPKTAAGVRRIDIPADLAIELAAYRARQEAGEITRSDPWVFPSETTREEGRPQVLDDRNFVQRHFLPACTAAKCPRVTPHSLRHLWASHLLEKGTPVAFVSRHLGHSSPAFTYKQYVHFLPDDGEKGRGYLDGAFGGAATASSAPEGGQTTT